MTSNSSDIAAHGDGAVGGNWRVLARLADVSESSSAPIGPSSRAAARDSATYRLDRPQRTAHPPAKAEPAVTAIHDPRSTAKPMAASLPKSSAHRTEAAILPASDPFSIPRPRVTDKLVPLGQFLTLFALFTIVGTLFLRSGNQAKPAGKIEPAGTVAKHVLEPQSLVAPSDVEPPVVAPTAAGPTGEGVPRTGLRRKQDQQSTHIGSHSAEEHEQKIVTDPEPLPQVQLSDAPVGEEAAPHPPVAVARLSGHIEAPARQAQHDDHRSSLH